MSGVSVATFVDGVTVAGGGSVAVEGGERIVAAAEAIDASGSQAVRIGSVGSMVTLNGEGSVEYVHFVWPQWDCLMTMSARCRRSKMSRK